MVGFESRQIVARSTVTKSELRLLLLKYDFQYFGGDNAAGDDAETLKT